MKIKQDEILILNTNNSLKGKKVKFLEWAADDRYLVQFIDQDLKETFVQPLAHSLGYSEGYFVVNGDELMKADEEQQQPIKNENPHIVDLVIEDIKARKELGIECYGTALQAFNGRDALRDLYEELQDATIYVKQVMEERGEKTDINIKQTKTAQFSEKDLSNLYCYLNYAVEELDSVMEESDNMLAVGCKIGKAIQLILQVRRELKEVAVTQVGVNSPRC